MKMLQTAAKVGSLVVFSRRHAYCSVTTMTRCATAFSASAAGMELLQAEECLRHARPADGSVRRVKAVK